MPLTIKVKSGDATVKARRKAAARRVIAYFKNRLPDSRLLCFFDDQDCDAVKQLAGTVANRGFHLPVLCLRGSGWKSLPNYVRDECFSDQLTWLFDDLIYLHGSTCSNEVGLTMTFAHELQHFVQHRGARQLYAANSLARELARGPHSLKSVIMALASRSWEIPYEREARIVSKRTAENLFGAERVGQYINKKIAETVTADDVADWEFIRGLATSTPYDLACETKLFFRPLKKYRPQIEVVLQGFQNDDPARDVDLDDLFSGA